MKDVKRKEVKLPKHAKIKERRFEVSTLVESKKVRTIAKKENPAKEDISSVEKSKEIMDERDL